ncbi:MAG: CPBP family glutamic-type intramembrane protease, partial [Promethearchaeota archaeon]
LQLTGDFIVCPYCGGKTPAGSKFCQNCGRDISKNTDRSQGASGKTGESEWRKVKIKALSPQGVHKSVNKGKVVPEAIEEVPIRVCPNCHTLIQSKVLEQCPVCYATLPPLKQEHKQELEKLLFVGNKLVSEKDLKPDKEKWTMKEGLKVSAASFMVFFVIELLVVYYLIFFSSENINSEQLTLKINSTTLFINAIVNVLIGLYPIIYIMQYNLSFKKLGFINDDKVMKNLLIGIFGGILYYLVDILTQSALSGINISLLNPPQMIDEQNAVIRNLGILYIPFIIITILGLISETILFRGVIHNSIAEKYARKGGAQGRFITILLTALVYSGTFFFLNLNLYFLILNFISAFIIGIFYELSNRNIWSIIMLQIVYMIINAIFFIY